MYRDCISNEHLFSCVATWLSRIFFVCSLTCETLRVFYFNLPTLFLINLAATAFERIFYDLFRIYMLSSLPQYLSISASAPTTPQCTCKCHYPHFTEEKFEDRVTKAIGTRVLGASPTIGWIKTYLPLWSIPCFPFLRLSGWQGLGLLRSRLSAQVTLSRMPVGPICWQGSCFQSSFRKIPASSWFAEARQMMAVRTGDS